MSYLLIGDVTAAIKDEKDAANDISYQAVDIFLAAEISYRPKSTAGYNLPFMRLKRLKKRMNVDDRKKQEIVVNSEEVVTAMTS